ncbi:hypothetical protein GHK29_02205 [Sinorhizobium medicae]|uniref:hypothetical protein n=1 Tax=Sinorhizobium medicae TaxID=110321 RepID=UPI001296E7C9|nr:hypothetical protein [Sinorhizobium medicae]MDX2388250.1 hypothetical protein [Sinorhizobium medicae]MQU73558.1 hypothetical protein [Sinorhizobium medicae]
MEARFGSAYKPLLHFFLEEVEIESLAAVHVIYPTHCACSENRFRQETYPLAGILLGARLTFEPAAEGPLTYTVVLMRKDGGITKHSFFVPNREHLGLDGERTLSPTGWIKVEDDSAGERRETDFEALFEAAIQAITLHDWGQRSPFFEELNIRVRLPHAEQPLEVGEETISMLEAMHEDLFFSLNEFFQTFKRNAEREIGERSRAKVFLRFATPSPFLLFE